MADGINYRLSKPYAEYNARSASSVYSSDIKTLIFISDVDIT